jgi:cytosol aminopeptidase
MGGSACVLSAMWAIAQLKPPKNVSCFIPLTENMPSGSATRPGDVVIARNGLSIEVDNTDAEGRLILADAIDYATTYNPHTIVELSTLTGAMDVALGNVYAGVFSDNDSLWEELRKAGEKAGDRFWRMPLDEEYHDQIKSSVADLKNVGNRSAGSCTAAIFLKQFIKKDSDIAFAHIGYIY